LYSCIIISNKRVRNIPSTFMINYHNRTLKYKILRTFNYGLMITMIDNNNLDEQIVCEDVIFN